MSVQHLDLGAFETRVARIDRPEWQYLGDKPALIDFFATWCGPCKALSPVLDKVAEKYAGKIYVYKVDIDREEELARAFNIRSVPTLLFVPAGGMPRKLSGLVPQDHLEQLIDTELLGK